MPEPIFALPLYPVFHDLAGKPLEAGYIYIGEQGQNAEANPVQVYWDAALTQPAAQPIRTIAGYPSRNGSPAAIYTSGDYSITVRSKDQRLVYTALTGVNIAAAATAEAQEAADFCRSLAFQQSFSFDTVAGQQFYPLAFNPGQQLLLLDKNGNMQTPVTDYTIATVSGVVGVQFVDDVLYSGDRITYRLARAIGYDPNLNKIEAFHSRADLVAHIAAEGAIDGQTYTAEGLLYLGQSGSTIIDDLPGLVPAGNWSFRHFGAAGDGVTDDGADINAAMAAYRSFINGQPEKRASLALTGEGLTYRSTVPIDMTKLQTWGWTIENVTILSEATGLIAVEQVGSRGGTYRNIIVYGDKTNRPSVGIYAARAAAGGGLDFCDNCIYEDVQTIGYYSVAGGIHYGQEETIYNRCGWWNYDYTGAGAYHVGHDAAFPAVTVTHEAPITGATSYINNQYNICSWRYLPAGRALFPTAITKGSSTVITANSIPADFAVGQSVTFFLIGGMTQINNLVGQITALTSTTMTVAIDSTGFSNFTSGGTVFGTQDGPSLVFGRGEGHDFSAAYVVAYGAPNVRHVFPDTSVPSQNTFNMLFEGSGSPTHFEFDGGATARQVLDYTIRTYNTHSRDSVLDTTGDIVWRYGELTVTNNSRGTPNLLGTPADFTFYAVDISTATTAGFTASATGGHTGRLYYFDTDVVSETALLKSTGDVDAEVVGGLAEFRAVSVGTVEGYLRLDTVSNGWIISGNGSTNDYIFAAGGFYPNSDLTYSLGLSSRNWSEVWARNYNSAGSYKYAPGQGAAVTQATSKATAVTINARTGLITTAADALAAGASVVFEVNNSTVTGLDMPHVNLASTSVNYTVSVVSCSAGRFAIRLTNISGGSLSQALAIRFALGIQGRND